jgi:hypothetical protein
MSSELSLAKTSDASSRIPDDKTLRELFKISLVEDKDIKSDYWRGSLDKSILIGVGKTSDGKDEKILVRSEEEYTSPINKVIKVIESDMTNALKYTFKEYSLINNIISKEDFKFITDSYGYYSELVEMNAVDTFKLIKHGLSDKL